MSENDFSSIDRLVEFGMGMAVAKQMMDTMNHTLDNMKTPGVQNSINGPKKLGEYFTIINEHQVGPLSEEEISSLIAKKEVTEDTFIWKNGMAGWRLVKDVPGIYKYILLNK